MSVPHTRIDGANVGVLKSTLYSTPHFNSQIHPFFDGSNIKWIQEQVRLELLPEMQMNVIVSEKDIHDTMWVFYNKRYNTIEEMNRMTIDHIVKAVRSQKRRTDYYTSINPFDMYRKNITGIQKHPPIKTNLKHRNPCFQYVI